MASSLLKPVDKVVVRAKNLPICGQAVRGEPHQFLLDHWNLATTCPNGARTEGHLGTPNAADKVPDITGVWTVLNQGTPISDVFNGNKVSIYFVTNFHLLFCFRAPVSGQNVGKKVVNDVHFQEQFQQNIEMVPGSEGISWSTEEELRYCYQGQRRGFDKR